MRTLLIVFLLVSTPCLASSEMLGVEVRHTIRKAGYWCDRVSDMRTDLQAKAKGIVAIKVTCDDNGRFAQYRLEFGPDKKIARIIKIE